MRLFRFPSGPLGTNAILLEQEGVAVVIDPSMGSAEKILQLVAELQIRIEKILLTHSHWDHIADLKELRGKTGAEVWVHRLDAENVERPGSDLLALPTAIHGVKPDRLLEDGDQIFVGEMRLEVIHTPGHSPGSVCFYVREQNLLISGDTLFRHAIGRTDLSTGSPQLMEKSLERLSTLPPDTRVLPGHGPETTIGKEL